MAGNESVLVVGSGGPLGRAILPFLRARGLNVTASFRTERPGLIMDLTGCGATPLRLDLRNSDALAGALEAHDAAVFTPILTVSAQAAQLLQPRHRAVFFSSNNVAIAPEEPLYAAIMHAEATLRRAAPRAVILRPTMIYGHPRDGNLSRLMCAARRWPVLPRPARGGLQQPVYYRDLAEAAAGVLLDPAWQGRTIAVGGPDVVSHRALYRAIYRAADRRGWALPVPIGLAIALAGLARRCGWPTPVSEAQLRRAARDKRVRGDDTILTRTPLAQGLGALAKAQERGGWRG